MTFKLSMPGFFRRKRGLAQLIRETEALSLQELTLEQVLAESLKHFNEFFEQSKEVEAALKKEYKDIRSKNDVLPYLERLLEIVRRIKISSTGSKDLIRKYTEILKTSC